ncbi:hypothetical protein [Nocardiopsis lambiniae]|uniref:Uncharacterized protein n=1 Tax=Nocardiopsis lambiniae TaxID=3075539 RepID=A0ABU2MF23_9ACTN|nr:hypothetical protein [Nocardiopsis sp. DSM 44743]MDT0331164.1 hypothetical protein [Nocardiopsis sp. DSM 44743]
MNPRSASGDGAPERQRVDAAPLPQDAPAQDRTGDAFRSALGGETTTTAGRRLEPLVEAASTPIVDAEPAQERPTRRIGSVLGGAERVDAPEAEPALDRPSAPLMAGAAIAGLILVAAPFAVATGVPATSLNVTANQQPMADGSAAGGQVQTGGDQSTSVGSNTASVSGGDGGSPVTDVAEDTGYVPEVRQDMTAPTMPDPGDASGGSSVETSSPSGDGAVEDAPVTEGSVADGENAPEGVSAAGAERPAAEGEGASGGETSGDGEGASGAEGTGEGTGSPEGGEAADDTGAEGAANGEGAATEDSQGAGTGDTGTTEETTGGTAGEAANGETPMDAPAGEPETPGTDAQALQDTPPVADGETGEPSSILEGATERLVPADETYLAISGPGCPMTGHSSYGHEGRWDSAEGTDSWATRPGGHVQEGCAGDYDAIPVSGDPERGNGQYATWTFTPGREGAVCELYVHVPDDESPLWIAPGEARYEIRPGAGVEEPTVAVFGFDQSQIRGGWVQVTGFVTPSESFTVQLTNAGADPLDTEDGASAHVAASAVRASCT